MSRNRGKARTSHHGLLLLTGKETRLIRRRAKRPLPLGGMQYYRFFQQVTRESEIGGLDHCHPQRPPAASLLPAQDGRMGDGREDRSPLPLRTIPMVQMQGARVNAVDLPHASCSKWPGARQADPPLHRRRAREAGRVVRGSTRMTAFRGPLKTAQMQGVRRRPTQYLPAGCSKWPGARQTEEAASVT